MSHSPVEASASRDYEQAWNAINELIRADGSWSGYERNVFYANNRDGTFSDVSGIADLDFPDDSRAFALSDFDHDGRLEIFLKNRTAPQLRVLRNVMEVTGKSIAFKLRGTKSNRDAIGAEVTVETEGGRQTKFLQAGSGFLSQHSKELSFGLGETRRPARATVRWPSGLVQQFENLPAGHRIEFEEASPQFRAVPFSPVNPSTAKTVKPQKASAIPSNSETWLVDPIAAPDFECPDLQGHTHTLKSFRGRPFLLNFWATWCPPCQHELEIFEEKHSAWAARGLNLVAANVNDPGDLPTVLKFVREHGYSFLILLANEDMLGVYNVLYRHLFDRRRDLGVPTSFLVDEQGWIVKIYQGALDPDHLISDLGSIPRTPAERFKKALPFPGQFYGGEMRRNLFTYGVAYFQRGFLDQAVISFELALRDNPAYAEAHYNLGTLYLKKKMQGEARDHLERALALRPDYPDALNNFGLLAVAEGRPDEAARYFEEAVRRRANYTIALENLGNLYRQQGRLAEAERALDRALRSDPEDPEVNYSLAMLFAQKDETDRAREYLERALKLRPEYPEALNNLGVLYLRTGRPAEAISTFQDSIRVAPAFDQPYLNLAKAYFGMGEREKAREILRRLLVRQPDHALARQALEQLSR